jgi:hypothetical protein
MIPDDLVKRLEALASYAERANHWTDTTRYMDASGVADTVYDALDRIKELEAKLSNKVCPLGKQCYQKIAYVMGQAEAAKAALKETKDE